MTLLEKLESHRGGLVRLPTQLFWYGRGWDRTPGRICLLLDAGAYAAAAYLLIDGQPRWIWVVTEDVEFL